MKILTITFHRSRNYGAALQAYALQQALKQCGYETQVVDYRRDVNKTDGRIDIKKIARNIAINLYELIHFKSRRIFKNRFNTFVEDNLQLTKKYEEYSELEQSPPEADMYLIGSDQVWNVTYRYRPEFFADFAPNGIKIASYAASFGRYDYNEQQLKKIEKGLSRVNPVSVREDSAKDFIKERFGKEALVHLDPVFLLDKEQWSSVAAEPDIKGKYILCFALTKSKLMQEAAKKLKKETGYKIVSISPTAVNFSPGDKNIYSAGPLEFLSYIKNAQYVLTNSFHGTAFSIIFEKNFYNFTSGYYSSRTTSILKKFSLLGRVPKGIDDVSVGQIDYTDISRKKQQLIQEAYSYLKILGDLV